MRDMSDLEERIPDGWTKESGWLSFKDTDLRGKDPDDAHGDGYDSRRAKEIENANLAAAGVGIVNPQECPHSTYKEEELVYNVK